MGCPGFGSLSSALGEPIGKMGRWRHRPQGSRLVWPPDNPSLLRGLCLEPLCESSLDRCPETWEEGKPPTYSRVQEDSSELKLQTQGVVQRLPRTHGDIPGGEQWSPAYTSATFAAQAAQGEALIKFRITMCKAQSEFCLLCHATAFPNTLSGL